MVNTSWPNISVIVKREGWLEVLLSRKVETLFLTLERSGVCYSGQLNCENNEEIPWRETESDRVRVYVLQQALHFQCRNKLRDWQEQRRQRSLKRTGKNCNYKTRMPFSLLLAFTFPSQPRLKVHYCPFTLPTSQIIYWSSYKVSIHTYILYINVLT